MNQDTVKTDGLEHSQNSVQQTENSQRSLGVKEVHDKGIFVIVETHDETENNCFIAIGRFRLSEKQTMEECERMIDQRDWNLIASLILMMNGEVKTHVSSFTEKEKNSFTM